MRVPALALKTLQMALKPYKSRFYGQNKHKFAEKPGGRREIMRQKTGKRLSKAGQKTN
jgi:hypothetical protein